MSFMLPAQMRVQMATMGQLGAPTEAMGSVGGSGGRLGGVDVTTESTVAAGGIGEDGSEREVNGSLQQQQQLLQRQFQQHQQQQRQQQQKKQSVTETRRKGNKRTLQRSSPSSSMLPTSSASVVPTPTQAPTAVRHAASSPPASSSSSLVPLSSMANHADPSGIYSLEHNNAGTTGNLSPMGLLGANAAIASSTNTTVDINALKKITRRVDGESMDSGSDVSGAAFGGGGTPKGNGVGGGVTVSGGSITTSVSNAEIGLLPPLQQPQQQATARLPADAGLGMAAAVASFYNELPGRGGGRQQFTNVGLGQAAAAAAAAAAAMGGGGAGRGGGGGAGGGGGSQATGLGAMDWQQPLQVGGKDVTNRILC